MFPSGCKSASCCISHVFAWYLLTVNWLKLAQNLLNSRNFYGSQYSNHVLCALSTQMVKCSGEGCGKLETSLAVQSLVHLKHTD